MTSTYPQPQFIALRNLARAYGHGWASEPDMPEEHPVPGCLWTHGLIAELYTAIGRRDRWESWQYGIRAPGAPNYSGAVCHTTGSGRLTWQVAADGLIGIVISRPAPHRAESDRSGVVVLSARVRDGQIEEIRTPDTRDHRIPDVYAASWAEVDGPRAEARHGDELLCALSAVVDRDEAIAALDRARVPRHCPHDAAQSEVGDALDAAGPDDVVIGGRGDSPVVIPVSRAGSARHTLAELAARVSWTMRPVRRAEVTAAILRQVAEIAGDLPLTPADACLAYEWLGQPLETDDVPTSERRATCREFVDALTSSGIRDRGADAAYPRMAAVFDGVIAALDSSADPRHQSMVATARREAAELRRVVTVI